MERKEAPTKEEVIQFARSLGIEAMGITSFPLPPSALAHLHDPNPCPFTVGEGEERLGLTHGNEALQRAIVCLFTYKVEGYEGPINLARYTWGEDYHLVIRKYLEKIVHFIEEKAPASCQEIHVDTSPLADRYMAYLAGLGFYGKNNCFIHPLLGSYLCIGTILTSVPFEINSPLNESCLNCGRCIAACPGQALGGDYFRYDLCKSYITQKKGDLTDEEKAIMSQTALIFGCDVCQEVCPHNRQVPLTPFEEFQKVQPYVNPDELREMTNRQFKEAYGHRAFSWRGKAILLRNDDIINDNNINDTIVNEAPKNDDNANDRNIKKKI